MKATPRKFAPYWQQSMLRFNRIIDSKIRRRPLSEGEYSLYVQLNVEADSMDLNMDTDEQYQLELSSTDDVIIASITSYNYFGARHALETLSQLIVFDEFSNQLKV